MLEAQYLKDGKRKYAYTAYPEGKYEEAKKQLTEFITKKALIIQSFFFYNPIG